MNDLSKGLPYNALLPALIFGGQRPPRQTPWGDSPEAKETIAGAWITSSDSHGGYWLSPLRRARLPKWVLDARSPTKGRWPYDEHAWFEEDCDWAYVVLAFEPEFTANPNIRADMIEQAALMLASTNPDAHAAWVKWRGQEPAAVTAGPWIIESRKGEKPTDREVFLIGVEPSHPEFAALDNSGLIAMVPEHSRNNVAALAAAGDLQQSVHQLLLLVNDLRESTKDVITGETLEAYKDVIEEAQHALNRSRVKL